MRVRLKGINHATKRLADGTIKRYWYAWRGGPLLRGEPGAPRVFRELQRGGGPEGDSTRRRAVRTYREVRGQPRVREFARRTQDDYCKQFKLICRNFGDLPLKALSDPRVRGVFKDWRDEIAKRSLRQADAAWIALARVLSWALDRRKIAVNPCEKGGRLYHGTRADKVWTLEQETAFLAVASEPLRRAYVLAIWTGQRQGDLLRLPWAAWDQTPLPKAPHGRIRLRQGKTGVGVEITVSALLSDMLDSRRVSRRLYFSIRMGSLGPRTASHRRGERRARGRARGMTFNDLRGTFVTRRRSAALPRRRSHQHRAQHWRSPIDTRQTLLPPRPSAGGTLWGSSKGEQIFPTGLPNCA